MPSLTIDNSMLEDFRTCERLYRNRYISGYMQDTESEHLHAGGAIACGVQRTREAYYNDGMEPDAAREAGAAALLEFWGDPQKFADKVKNLRSVTRAFHQYFEDFPVDTHWPIHRFPDGKLAVELHFEIPFFDHIYCGTPDAIVEYGGGLWLVDEKTTGGYLNDQWASQWKRRAQFSGYVYAMKHRGIKIDGVLVRGIQILKGSAKTAEYPFPRSEWMVQEWSWETQRAIRRILEATNTGDWGCSLGDGCVKFGRECEFMKQCNSPNPDYSKFKRGVWVPERREWVPITPEGM